METKININNRIAILSEEIYVKFNQTTINWHSCVCVIAAQCREREQEQASKKEIKRVNE